MTMELLYRIIEENNIPSDVRFMSDSAWEGGPTEMDGVFYNRESNTIVFTPGGCPYRDYDRLDEWEILYIPNMIKLEGLEVYPASDRMAKGLTKAFKKAIQAAGDFENYYGIPESKDAYNAIDLKRPLYYCIKIKGDFIGYIGLNGDENVLELEMYIFEQYRNKGYGSRVLKKFIDMAFKGGLIQEKNGKAKKVFPEKLISTVREDNEYSQRMMKKCGFIENKDALAEYLGFIDENDEIFTIEIKKYYLSKKDHLRNHQIL